MTVKLFIPLLCISALAACASQNPPMTESQAEPVTTLPERSSTLSIFSALYRFGRDTERSTYNLLYDLRDSTDSFMYDVQKSDDYQK